MTKELETTPVYFHDCRVLGSQVKVPRALMADAAGEYILFYQHKCPFCDYTVAGTKEYATGVVPDTLGGYYIDEKIAEKLHN